MVYWQDMSESLQYKESTEVEKKIENIQKNLLEYFDSDFVKWLYEKSKNNFVSVEEKISWQDIYNFYYKWI